MPSSATTPSTSGAAPSHRLAQSSFNQHEPTLFAGQLLPGLEKALIGQKMGSRVLAVIPPKDAFGTSGNSQAGIKGTDTLVFVVDLIKNFAANASASGQQVSSGGGALPKVTATTGAAPKIKMPSSKPPDQAGEQGPGQGDRPGHQGQEPDGGRAVRRRDVAERQGERDGVRRLLEAAGSRSASSSAASPSQVIPGWDKGLIGQTVGSRVMLVIPPADGYGKTGNSQAGIKGTDTLVFVVDILGAFG